MKAVRLGKVVVFAGVAAVGIARAGSDAGGGSFTVLALDRADFHKGGRVSGSVGVVEGRLRLDRNVSVAGTVAAPHVVLRPRTTVEQLRCDVVTGGTLRCEPLPVIDPAIFVRPDAQSGSDDVHVPKKSRHSALAAGAYGKLTVGTGGEMLLAGGDYAFQSVRLDSRVTFQCLAPCTVAIKRGLKIGREATIFGAETGFRVAGRGGRAVKVGSEATVGAVIYAPTAAVKLGDKVSMRGTILARRVPVGARSHLGPVDPSATAE